MSAVDSSPLARPTFREACAFWTKLGFISFGGPTGQIAILHHELVDRRRWIDEERFLHALNFCMFLPGPEATQLATYCGWTLHGTKGGIVAGTLFVLPSFFLLLALSWIYVEHGDIGWVASVFYGLKPAVMALVASAVLRIGKKALKGAVKYLVAAAAFVAIYFFELPFPAIVAAAALLGYALSKGAASKAVDSSDSAPRESSRSHLARALRVIAVCGALWFAPIVAAGLVQGWDGVLAQQGLFFSKAAMVTFGGAYAVLPYVARNAVETYGWLAPHEMVDGLGLAETTPGPLIMVVEFVAYLGGARSAGAQPSFWAGTLSAAMTVWVTFVPCFLWIFVGAPHIERMRKLVRWSDALAMVTAAVVGVVLNLAVWFARETLLPSGGALDVFALVVGLVAFFCLQKLRWEAAPVVLASGAIGLVYRTFTG